MTILNNQSIRIATIMQLVLAFTFVLAAIASAAPSHHIEHASYSESELRPNRSSPQVVPVVSSSPAVQGVQPVVGSPVHQAGVEVSQPIVGSSVEQHHHHQQPSPAQASYYAPAGVITVVGNEQQGVSGKPVGASVRNFEQYGQPESASIPANYKPFGSWGLYIGGNPADGYYTNYYKALGQSVDKQQVQGGEMKPVIGSQTAAFSPVLKQAGSSPYVGNEYYPFAYSPSELNVGAPVQYSAVSPVQVGAQVYGAPSAFESNYGVSSYATKKMGAAYSAKEPQQASKEAGKGYQSRVYVYPSPVVGQLAAPGVVASSPAHQVHAAQGHQQHVVAYPVPVGSQIVGSQQGVDGAFTPYGVHAFTRYAVKPTMMNQEPSYYYNVPSQQSVQPAYKQQVQSSPSSSYYPMSFYGYPMNQLHYSQGSVVPSVQHGQEVHHGPMPAVQVEGASSEKVESEDKFKQQKKA